MAETELTPYLSKFLEESGLIVKGVEQACGERMHMPDRIHTQIDQIQDPIYADLKVGVLVTLAGVFIDKHFPKLSKEKGENYRGQMVFRLGCEVYRILTDGLSIDVLRHVTGYPDPYKGKTS